MATKAEIMKAIDLSFDDDDQIVWQAVAYDEQFKNMFGMSREKWNEFVEVSEHGSVIADDLTDLILEFASEYEDD
jgi:hypothetical protein